MTTNAQAMVLASFAADALSLPAHWVYDTAVIDQEFGIINKLLSPTTNQYHGNKERGDFTHYGTQAFVLLKHLAENKEFNLSQFAIDWQKFSQSSTGYIDGATKKTLAALDNGTPIGSCGSSSNDLGGPARLAPLIFRYHKQPEKLMTYALKQTRFTHSGSSIEPATKFIVQATLSVLDGEKPGYAISQLIDDGVNDLDLDMRLQRCKDTVEQDSRQVIGNFGQMCSTSAALPGAVHLILKYEDNLNEALIQNVMAGGDSAARGLVVGMILGAHQGITAIDKDWLEGMQKIDHIREYLNPFS